MHLVGRFLVPGVHVVQAQEGGEGRVVDEEFNALRKKHFTAGLIKLKPHLNLNRMVQQFLHDTCHGAYCFGLVGSIGPAFRLTALCNELLAPKLDAKHG